MAQVSEIAASCCVGEFISSSFRLNQQYHNHMANHMSRQAEKTAAESGDGQGGDGKEEAATAAQAPCTTTIPSESSSLVISAAQMEAALEAQGTLVGIRLAERLVCREGSVSPEPLAVARLIAGAAWRAMFGKSADVLRATACETVFYIVDRRFRWLQGFPRLREDCERIQSTQGGDVMNSNNGNGNGNNAAGAGGVTAGPSSAIHNNVNNSNNNNNGAVDGGGAAIATTPSTDAAYQAHRNVLLYAVGVVKGLAHMLSEEPVLAHASHARDGETTFVLDFRAGKK